MTTPPPARRVRIPKPPVVRRRYEREPRASVPVERPIQPYIPKTNVFRDAPWGTPCALSKCKWEARYVVQFWTTGGSAAYCDDHAWPFRPRREIAQRAHATTAAMWETP